MSADNDDYKNTILDRTMKLREELSNIESNREKLNFMKNYYEGKTAIVVATGPKFQDHTPVIKENINDNTILITIKQSLLCFDYVSDFHLLNRDHLTHYLYNNDYPKPITLMTNYPKRKIHTQHGDIHFFLTNAKNNGHTRKCQWDSIDNNIKSFDMNDENLGSGENMVINSGHIMMESVLPLCVHLGIKKIIFNGWVGGSKHGINVGKELDWTKCKRLYKEQEKHIRISEKIPMYFKDNYDIDMYTICESKYMIQHITHEELYELCNISDEEL